MLSSGSTIETIPMTLLSRVAKLEGRMPLSSREGAMAETVRRVLVCGGRKFDDFNLLAATMEPYRESIRVVIHGGAHGADSLAETWANEWGKGVHRFPAQWGKYGKAAGPIRNQRMIDVGKPDIVIAMPGGVGTADMVRRAQEAGLRVVRPTPPGDGR